MALDGDCGAIKASHFHGFLLGKARLLGIRK
jgi:hypothetical protein